MADAPFDVAVAHRWFAVELNNLAWDLVEAEERSPEDVDRMIHAAHAACYHWMQVGSVLNHLRAQCLLSSAYVRAGQPDAAVLCAEKCLSLSRLAGEAQTAFDEATAHGCASAAYRAAGRIGQSQNEYNLAIRATRRFDDPADRKVFDRLFPGPSEQSG